MAFFDFFHSKRNTISSLLTDEFNTWVKVPSYSISENVFYKYLNKFSPNEILIESLNLIMDGPEKDQEFYQFLIAVIENGIQEHMIHSREGYMQFLEKYLGENTFSVLFIRLFSFSTFFSDLLIFLEQSPGSTGEDIKINKQIFFLLERFFIMLPKEGGLYKTPRERSLIKEVIGELFMLPIFENYRHDSKIIFGQDEFGAYLQRYVNILPEKNMKILENMFFCMRFHDEKKLSQKAKRYFIDCRKNIGEGIFDQMLIDFSETILGSKIYETDGGWYKKLQFFSEESEPIVRDVIMLLGIFRSQQFLQLLGKLARKFYKKIPNKGPGSILLGNACVEAIATGYGIDGVSLLFGLSEEVRHPSSRKTLQKWIEKIGITSGLTREELEDKTQKDFGFQDRTIIYNVGSSQIKIMLLDNFSVDIVYIEEDGKFSKSPSKFVKETFLERLKDIKNIKKEIEQFITYQKRRLEYLMISQRRVNYEEFSKNMLQNTSIQPLIDGLLFRKINNQGGEEYIILDKEHWVRHDNTIISLESGDMLELIHPIQLSGDDLSFWSTWLHEKQKATLIKQLDREIFYNTDDLPTLFSKKLQQHQVVELAKFRGWDAILQGDFDSGKTEYKKLYPFCNIECSIQTDIDTSSIAESGTGIAYYISFHSIGWKQYTDNDTLDINIGAIPPQVLSEALRDIHLFCHIGGREPDISIKDFLEGL